MTEELTRVPPQPGRHEQNFDVALRGYDRNQVDRHIGHLDRLLTEAHAEIERLRDGRPSYRDLGGRIAQMLTLAEDQADEIRTDATRATEDVRRQAQEAAEAAEREESERREKLDREERERRETLDREEAQRREQSQRDGDEAVTAARERAGHIIAEAEQQADTITAAARQELDRLGERREEIRGELEALRERLGAAVSGTVPASGQSPTTSTSGPSQEEHTTAVLPADPETDSGVEQ